MHSIPYGNLIIHWSTNGLTWFPQCGFFDRARPPADDNVSDQEQLTSDHTGDA